MPSKPGKVVFDNLTEPQLVDVFKEVGRVVSFRLLFDRETGKPKGYGFCTFEDAETASSAVRNLNNATVGGRQLRVDFSDNEKDDFNPPRQLTQPLMPIENDLNNPANPINANTLANNPDYRVPPQNAFQRPPINTPAHDPPPLAQQYHYQTIPPQLNDTTKTIDGVIDRYSPDQLVQVLSQLKLLVHEKPDVAKFLLLSAPQLTYAIFQALLATPIVDKRVLMRPFQQNAQFRQPSSFSNNADHQSINSFQNTFPD